MANVVNKRKAQEVVFKSYRDVINKKRSPKKTNGQL